MSWVKKNHGWRPLPLGSGSTAVGSSQSAIPFHDRLPRHARVPGRPENWGIWSADDTDRLHDALSSLPLFRYLTITVHPLASHPNDPMRLDRASEVSTSTKLS